MRRRILHDMKFRGPRSGWDWPADPPDGFEVVRRGLRLAAPWKKGVRLNGPGVHTRTGDSIELHFRLLEKGKGVLSFGFMGGFESEMVRLDFRKREVSLSTTDWTRPQPMAKAPFRTPRRASHVLLIGKSEGAGGFVKNADITVRLDGHSILRAKDVNVLPERGVTLSVSGTRVLVERFVQRGVPSGIPEYLHVGGWQVLNRPSVDENLASLHRGLREAADKGVQLLLTPETSITGLFPSHKVTQDPKLAAAADRKLRRFMRDLKNAPHLVAGLPVWRRVPGHRLDKTRYNDSRVYDPDGHVVSSHAKVHSCESHFHHGYRLNEFDVLGVPVCLHICHDGRYPEVWTLPVMFGARLILHPMNGGKFSGSVDALESRARLAAATSHAFYLRVNGSGGSFLVGPEKPHDPIAVSPECRRDNPAFPQVGEPADSLFHANIRIHDAFGYWPVRSFRASKAAAEAYVTLYRALGGKRLPE